MSSTAPINASIQRAVCAEMRWPERDVGWRVRHLPALPVGVGSQRWLDRDGDDLVQNGEWDIIRLIESDLPGVGEDRGADSPDGCEPRTNETKYVKIARALLTMGYRRPVTLQTRFVFRDAFTA